MLFQRNPGILPDPLFSLIRLKSPTLAFEVNPTNPDSALSRRLKGIIDTHGDKGRQWKEQVISRLYLDRLSGFEAKAFLRFCLIHKDDSHAQLFQDLFVRYQLREQTNGYFIEFGATDGVDLSNTKSLEERLGWTGILVEPGRCWHKRLKENRSSIIDTRCVWEKTGESVEFNEVDVEAKLSTIKAFNDADHHGLSRAHGKSYQVETVSLVDLLSEHHAPEVIDYLSIDTEGSELSILKSFDFRKYHIRIITVEHNYTPQRENIFRLLKRNGFLRKFTDFSLWDDWYINKAI